MSSRRDTETKGKRSEGPGGEGAKETQTEIRTYVSLCHLKAVGSFVTLRLRNALGRHILEEWKKQKDGYYERTPTGRAVVTVPFL